ncbi:MAG: DUF389 domain-containing protein [Ardenticatenales bacterium]|nr:DUF389 domain-containing protein [Ardenticatenales bacterium]
MPPPVRPGADQLPATQYRVLLPLDRERRRPGMLKLGLALARAMEGEVLALHVITPDEVDDEASWSLPSADADELRRIPHQVITTHADTIAEGILRMARRERCDLILLSWRGQPRSLRHRLGGILDPVLEDAPCDIALIRGELSFEEGALQAARLFLATAGGPHSTLALQLGLALARLCEGKLTLATVVKEDATLPTVKEAEATLARLIDRAKVTPEEAETHIHQEVLQGNHLLSAIDTAAQHHDLLLLGSTADSFFDQLFLGSLVEELVQGIPKPILVVRRHQGRPRFWLRRVWRWVDAILPSVSDEELLATYKRIRRGARATVDFYTLILLSVIIATMGLLLNSGAVIIGAMLVAPLMTPIIALGLGVVLGDARLLGVAGRSTAQGILLGVVLAALLDWLAPLVLFTPEIEARTQPNLFDLTVALAAGAAGAFSVTRKHVSAALPGVAIAAALVPPLCVVGICLATGRRDAALGASLLFGTNLVAISFAATLTRRKIQKHP